MAFVTDLRRTVTDATPVMAAVGITDLAVEKVREARTQALATSKSFAAIDPKGVQHELSVQATKSVQQARETPAHLINRGLELAGKAQEQYDDLAARGEKLVQRIRTQRSTQDLIAQVDQTLATGKGAVTTARKAVAATQTSARATFTTGRKQAVKTVDAIVDTVEDDIDTLAPVVEDSVKRTRTAAKKTATTARKGAVRTSSRTRATATTAKKATTRARAAGEATAAKVGD